MSFLTCSTVTNETSPPQHYLCHPRRCAFLPVPWMDAVKDIVTILLVAVLAFHLGRRSVRHPLADHRSYMLSEYPDIMAFTVVEMKIDKFLLDLEQRDAQ
jgi:hypothetical protein